jgi:hypothetical protein
MKSIITLCSIALSLSASAFQTGMGPNGPWTVGPLGYTDPFVSSQGVAVSSAGSLAGSSVGNPTLGSSAGTSASLQMKTIAIRVINDAEEYFQSGEMSVLLSTLVERVTTQNKDLSLNEAVSIVVEFADSHI